MVSTFVCFQLTFVNRFLILDVDYVLFTKQNALEISSCGRDQLRAGNIYIYKNPKLRLQPD